MQRAVVFITQPEVQRNVGLDFPLVLYITDVERLMHERKPRLAGKRAGSRGIAIKRDLGWRIGQKGVNIGETISGAPVERSFQMVGPDFDAELHVVIAVNPGEVIDEG